VTGSAKTGLSHITGSLFLSQLQGTYFHTLSMYFNTLSSFTTDMWQSLLLVVFLVIQMSGIYLWWCRGIYTCIGMCMTVSFVVLNEDLCCLFTKILASCESCMVHSKFYFISSPSTDIFHESLACHLALRHPLIVEFTWYYYLRVTLCKETVFNGG